MGHSFRILTNRADWEPFRAAYEAEGGVFPVSGIMFAEFDEQGEPVACQFLQTGAMFAEGLLALRSDAHLRTLWHMVIDYAKAMTGGEGTLLTMVRKDEQGQRIGKAVEHLKFKDAEVTVYRRELCH